MHDLAVIITLAGALAGALVFGWITQRLGLSTLVGYMIAGIVVGPYTPGFVANSQLASQMAEIGVILLMFGVGMHFHPQELLRVWRIALPGAAAQSLVAALLGWIAARAFGWTHHAGIVFGMALAVASTVVLMRMLVERDRLSDHSGHVAVGWLIVEDLFTVVALVMLPALAAPEQEITETAWALTLALGKAGVFAALVWVFGTRLLSAVLERIVGTRSSELFTLTVFVVALGVAILAAEVFHVSVALGAFFAGLVVGQSRFGAQAAADMAPFRDVFSALFFVSVGMLFNPALLMSQPLMVLSAIAIVMIAKPLVAVAIVLLLRDSARTALTVAVGLAQIGEFSFILAALGRSLEMLPAEGMDVLVIAAIASIAVNPLLFRALDFVEARRARRVEQPRIVSDDSPGHDRVRVPVILTGRRALVERLAERCSRLGIPLCVIDDALERLERFDDRNVSTVFGDAGRREVLEAAGAAGARVIVVTDAELSDKMRVCISARALNPRIAIVATSNSRGERAWLQEFGVSYICDAVDEISETLLRSIRSEL